MNYKREGKGQALVLVHGFLLSSGFWQPLIELLKDRLDIIVPDLPGFAGSGYFPAKDDIPGMAESVLDLLDELEMKFFSYGTFNGRFDRARNYPGARFMPRQVNRICLFFRHRSKIYLIMGGAQ